jgi:hypothetical protein
MAELLRSTIDKGIPWDQAFSLVFVCLIVIGKSQVGLVERAQVGLACSILGLEPIERTMRTEKVSIPL